MLHSPPVTLMSGESWPFRELSAKKFTVYSRAASRFCATSITSRPAARSHDSYWISGLPERKSDSGLVKPAGEGDEVVGAAAVVTVVEENKDG